MVCTERSGFIDRHATSGSIPMTAVGNSFEQRMSFMNRRHGWMLLLALGVISNTGCHLLGNHKGCKSCNNCQPGCRPGPIGWQRGGTDYGAHLNHRANHYANHHANHQDYAYQEAGSGVPAAAVAYPYYTNRGPRDFLINNPPSIGR
jgi:hypothetical protein